MKKTRQGHYKLAATDLAKFLSCSYSTRLDKEVAEKIREKPAFTDPHYFTIDQLGLEHERKYVDALKSSGLSVTELHEDETDGETHVKRTIDAMQKGYDIIVQAAFESESWFGKADILRKVSKPGILGDWSYEVMDTKLGQETKAGAVLQLCVYSDLLTGIQGIAPEWMYIVKPGDPFNEEKLRYDDFAAYYRWIKRKLESAMSKEHALGVYPEPVSYCDTCRWWSECDKQRRADDHLSFVAGLHASHSKELKSQELKSLTSFAKAVTIRRPGKGSIETLQRLQKQAQLQLKQQKTEIPQYEYLEFSEGEGLSRIPEPDAGDIFFDIEGDHFFRGGGIEYLLGIVYREDDEWRYKPFWGFTRPDEKLAFSVLMEFIMHRRNAYPGMHIYHFSPYEPNAMKHLMLRHSIYAEELDNLLRGGRFIDLHQVLKESIRAGVEKYGLKEMEEFYEFKRQTVLKSASQSLRNVQRALELDFVSEIKQSDLDVIAAYNREDCLSTAMLREWLEQRRAECIAAGAQIDRPESGAGEASENTQEREVAINAVIDLLFQALPADNTTWDYEDRSIFLLSNLLEYFRREEKSSYWEYLHINDLEPEDLLDERKVVYGLEFLDTVLTLVKSKKATLPVHRYRYPPQEFSGDSKGILVEISPLQSDRRKIGTIQAHDLAARTVDIKKRGDSVNTHPAAVQIQDFVSGEVLENSLLAFALNIAENGVRGTGKFQAGRDLLFRSEPRFESDITLQQHATDITAKAITLSSNLHSSILAIQGPPGTGKTYNGAQIICALYAMGKKIGVTAVSHKVIDNLLEWVDKIAQENGQHVMIAHRDGHEEYRPASIESIATNKVLEKLEEKYLVGATAYVWARDEMEEQLDYLIIDEAGQMALAYALAISRCARNLILLGDPRQLEQPQKAAHPEGADVSALQHYIGDHKVIEESRGLFLDTTWRLHPGICAFTSQLYYENRLVARPGLEMQMIQGNAHLGSQQLVYIPVSHSGNSNFSPEEIETIHNVVTQLLVDGTKWTDVSPDGTSIKPLTEADIMIIAPYNAQVSALKRRMPSLQIGTVDKFQGQEAAVVIYSMTSSAAEDAPRGMSFLYLPNRLNVASSRAKCLFILVASPKLLEPECKTPEQMKWANGLCMFREVSQPR